MALTSKLTKTIEIPHEPGETMTIRKLSFGQLEEARQARQDAALRTLTAMAGLQDQLSAVTATPEAQEAAARAASDPRQQYDQAIVLRRGITAWTYAEACTPEAIDELDEETAACVFDAIIAFSVRSAEQGEAFAGVSPSSTDSMASAASRQS